MGDYDLLKEIACFAVRHIFSIPSSLAKSPSNKEKCGLILAWVRPRDRIKSHDAIFHEPQGIPGWNLCRPPLRRNATARRAAIQPPRLRL
jgi:hypothetical protein